jgi:hypothetical protein
MIHEIPKPDISPAFTIEDIHKIREWNYERLKDATPEERRADIERHASITRQAIADIRAAKLALYPLRVI